MLGEMALRQLSRRQMSDDRGRADSRETKGAAFMTRHVIVAVAALGLTACTLRESTLPVVRVEGALTYFERLALPPAARVDVELLSALP